MKALTSAAVLAFSTQALCAGELKQRHVDPQVAEVRTAGSWDLGSRHGEYRVVVANIGYEHATTQVRFEWIDHSGGAEAPNRIAKTQVLHDSFLGAIGIDSINADAKGVIVVFSGELQDGSKYSCRVSLGPAGILSKSAGC